MSLSLNSLLDRWKQKFLQFAGDTEFRDQLIRGHINYQDFKLTAAQLDAANATPVTILAAPGSGLVNNVIGIMTKVAAGATAFELGSGTLGYLLTDGSGAAVATAVPNATVEATANSTVYYWSPGSAVAALPNAVIVAKPSADVTAGDGTIYGRIYYVTCKHTELS